MKKQLLIIGMATMLSASAMAIDVRVTITNMAPANGTYLTPTWFGFHDGNFDSFNVGAAASMGIERIAEDGNPAVLDGEFIGSGAGTVSGVLNGIGPIGPGASTSKIVTINENLTSSLYFSWASMIIPSNDAFIGNDNARQHRLFSNAGAFVGMDFIVLGSQVWDSGTEVNDEIPMNTAFFGQMAPNTGTPENGVVGFHQGFNPGGNILSSAMFANANFKTPGYTIARIQVESVPEPATISILGLGVAGYLARRKRK
ncbi:MAG: spondin domain-containing protein [Fimbriimonadaceae bacterium]